MKPCHAFRPGDAANGWELQCSVSVPVREAGLWVRANCGGRPEDHQDTTDRQHSQGCAEWTRGDDHCDCWASKLPRGDK